MSQNHDTPFYVGYLPTPDGLKLFLVSVAAGLIGMFAALALATGAAQDDPGDGAFMWGWGAQTVTGVMHTKPYPVLHVTSGSERLPAGRALLLSGPGKRGVQARVAKLDGKLVTLKGIALKRGDLLGLQVGGGKQAIQPAAGGGDQVAIKPLGRWRLKGEVCDGKCLVGAMRPSRGLAHKACANLCLIGGAPPVFVATAAIDGSEFFLIGDKNGNALSASHLKHVAKYLSIEGEVERRGDILVFKADFATLKVL